MESISLRLKNREIKTFDERLCEERVERNTMKNSCDTSQCLIPIFARFVIWFVPTLSYSLFNLRACLYETPENVIQLND